jgi:hypothetical protein
MLDLVSFLIQIWRQGQHLELLGQQISNEKIDRF